jgi:hypothetical protein
MLSHNPTMAVTTVGHLCSLVQQTRRSCSHYLSKHGGAAPKVPTKVVIMLRLGPVHAHEEVHAGLRNISHGSQLHEQESKCLAHWVMDRSNSEMHAPAPLFLPSHRRQAHTLGTLHTTNSGPNNDFSTVRG